MKSSRLLPSVMVSLSLSLLSDGIVHAKPINYNFTEVASTRGDFKTFSTPVINNLGVVAFEAELDAGGEGIFSNNGNTTTTIANTSQYFSFLEDDVSINDFGTVAFIASQNLQLPYTIGVYTSNGRVLRTIITTPTTDESGVGFRANSFEEVSINNRGIVGFIESISGRVQTILTSDGRTTNTIVNPTTPFLSGLQINDLGTIVYQFGPLGIYTGDNVTTPPIATAIGIVGDRVEFVGPPSINNIGTFAYVRGVADLTTNQTVESQIFTKSGDTETTITDTSGDFQSFDFISINDKKILAFLANFDTGGKGIFTAKNRRINKVIATGDSLFGYTVVDLSFASEGQNNTGQITFVATLANGTQAIVRANPK